MESPRDCLLLVASRRPDGPEAVIEAWRLLLYLAGLVLRESFGKPGILDVLFPPAVDGRAQDAEGSGNDKGWRVHRFPLGAGTRYTFDLATMRTDDAKEHAARLGRLIVPGVARAVLHHRVAGL